MNTIQSWLVVNGKAASDPELRAAVGGLRDRDHDLQVRVTWEAGDADRITREAADSGADRVIAGGGDGTLHEVAETLAQLAPDRRPSLGIVPLGTGNDFAAAAGIPLDSSREALEVAIRGPEAAIDLGEVLLDGEDSRRFFVNGLTVGPGAAITTMTPDELKGVLGGAAYYLQAALQARRAEPSQVRISGDVSFEGSAWGVLILNGRLVGPRVAMAPEAIIDDGRLEVVVVEANAAEVLSDAIGIMAGLAGNADSQTIRRWQAETLEIAADGVDVTIDGEHCQASGVQVAVRAGALRCALPEDCPMLGAARRSE